MAARPTTHAPDGGSIPGALCEEPTGDVSIRENDVDCPECLDELEKKGARTFAELARPIEDFWSPDRSRPQRLR